MNRSPGIVAGRLAGPQLANNFADICPKLEPNLARVEADRCFFCYDAPCIKACPTGIDIPLFIRQIAAGNPVGAAKTILDANIMGGTCARVCPTETLCEEACVREVSEGEAVTIGRLQRFATDTVLDAGKQLYAHGPATGMRVAVIGAGPAGLSCAHRLATLGHEVTIFEAKEKPGGLNEHGIAAYKLTDDFAQHEVAYILGVGGITIEYGRRFGRDVTLQSLRSRFDALFLGIGLGGTNALGLGALPEGVVDAVAYIERLRQCAELSAMPVGRRVIVVGGGMTAIDIAAQTKRLGADEVTICYRRGKAQMNASLHEQQLALDTGVAIRHWLQPKRLIADAGKLSAVEFEYTTDGDGAFKGTGELITLPCDQLFAAIGQTFLTDDLGDAETLAMTKGRIAVDADCHTSIPDIWAGGDCVAGGSDLTVSAVEHGKRAAVSIDRYLKTLAAPRAA